MSYWGSDDEVSKANLQAAQSIMGFTRKETSALASTVGTLSALADVNASAFSAAASAAAASKAANAANAVTSSFNTAASATNATLSDLDTLKERVEAIEPHLLQGAIEDVLSDKLVKPPMLMIEGISYNVTFQDPSKPVGSAYKRFQVDGGSKFYLETVRSTKTNKVIFVMKAESSVQATLKRYAKGAGLQRQWDTAEFTLKNLNEGRMTATTFLKDVLHTFKSGRDYWREDMEVDTELTGTW